MYRIHFKYETQVCFLFKFTLYNIIIILCLRDCSLTVESSSSESLFPLLTFKCPNPKQQSSNLT